MTGSFDRPWWSVRKPEWWSEREDDRWEWWWGTLPKGSLSNEGFRIRRFPPHPCGMVSIERVPSSCPFFVGWTLVTKCSTTYLAHSNDHLFFCRWIDRSIDRSFGGGPCSPWLVRAWSAHVAGPDQTEPYPTVITTRASKSVFRWFRFVSFVSFGWLVGGSFFGVELRSRTVTITVVLVLRRLRRPVGCGTKHTVLPPPNCTTTTITSLLLLLRLLRVVVHHVGRPHCLGAT